MTRVGGQQAKDFGGDGQEGSPVNPRDFSANLNDKQDLSKQWDGNGTTKGQPGNKNSIGKN
jgi:hypothetical protein